VPNTAAVDRLVTWTQRVRREGFKLTALVAVTVVAFFGTRAAAERMRAESLKDAAEWNRRGADALASGDTASAVDDFRRAARHDRTNRAYALALADALVRDRQDAGAERILLGLRDDSPEDPDINLPLARLSAGHGDLVAATRYYRNALYAPWPDTKGPQRIRLELIRFFLDHGDRTRALAELVVARANVDPSADAHNELGELFVRAGDWRLALDEFQQAVRLDPHSQRAMRGAGLAAYESGDYPGALAWLSGAGTLPADLAERRDVASLVISNDPLASRLGTAVRRERLMANAAYVNGRLEACARHPSVTVPGPRAVLDQDAIEDVLAEIADAEHRIESDCAPLTTMDRALVIIAQRHRAEPS
jgi:Tfp pilus assembly protein PilF